VLREVVIDSRTAGPGTLFVALPGQVYDGHEFVVDAVGHGAQAALVRTDWQPPGPLGAGVALIRVPDTLRGLQALATWWRSRFPALKVIGITGSIGKTSTKEYTGAVLATAMQVFRSEGNYNSETGLPLSVLRLQPQHEVAVFEMGGGSRMGELSDLAAIAQPQVGVITNVSHSHLASMGTLDNLAFHKGELVRALPPAPHGVAVLNYDDERVRAMAATTPARVITYGLNPAADLWADEIESRGLSGVQFTLHRAEEAMRLRLPLLGVHSVHTALRAAAACEAVGMNWKDIVVGLQTGEAQQLRLLVAAGINGTTIIDDSYNANPASMAAALQTLKMLCQEGRAVAVLGDMLELGTGTEEAHRELGRLAATCVERLYVLGEMAQEVARGAAEGGLPAAGIVVAKDHEEISAELIGWLKDGDCVLFKGSRGMRMERVAQSVRASLSNRVKGGAN
jgi:UDP-N-acetylmuramoyl-tripeptide--D-alanyl-D-alanine ligase